MSDDLEEKETLSRFYDAYFQSSKQFDNQVLYISSGALGLSFAFVQDIVSLNDSDYKFLLLLSWVLFTIVIFSSFLSHYYSKKALNLKIKLYHQEDSSDADKLNKRVVCLNKSMIWLLLSGLLSLITFLSINIY